MNRPRLLVMLPLLFFLFIEGHGQQKEIDSLQLVLKQADADTARVKLMMKIADFKRKITPDSALAYSEDILKFIHERKLDYAEPEVQMMRALCMRRKGRFQEANQVFHQLLRQQKVAAPKGYIPAVGTSDLDIIKGLANVQAELGDIDSAIYYAEMGLAKSDPATQADKIAGFNVIIGTRYSEKGNYSLAIQFLLKALRTYKELHINNGSLSVCLGNIGQAHMGMNNFREALGYYLAALKVAEEIKEVTHQSTVMLNIGSAYIDLNQLDSAHYFLTRSLTTSKSWGGKFQEAWAHYYLGLLYVEEKKFDEAVKEENIALAMHEALGHQRGVCATWLALGRAYTRLKDTGKARACFEKSLALADLTASEEMRRKSLRELAKTSAMAHDYAKANEYWETYEVLRDTLDSHERSRQFAEMDAIYRTQEKEVQIGKLREEALAQDLQIEQQKRAQWITIIVLWAIAIVAFVFWQSYRNKKRNFILLEAEKQKTEAQNHDLTVLSGKLENMVEEKSVLLKELHHRVKNNLQVIMSLLNMQVSTLTDSEALKFLKEGQNRIRAIELIHRQLYNYSDLASIGFIQYTQELVRQLDISYNYGKRPVSWRVEGNEFFMNVERAVPLGLILNELVTNAFKYAFVKQDHPALELDVYQQEGTDTLVLLLQDNGVGLPADFDVETASSLGQRLVRSLVGQLNGTVAFENNERGLQVRIQLQMTEAA